MASHILSRNSKRLSKDWERAYQHPIYFPETFVDPQRLVHPSPAKRNALQSFCRRFIRFCAAKFPDCTRYLVRNAGGQHMNEATVFAQIPDDPVGGQHAATQKTARQILTSTRASSAPRTSRLSLVYPPSLEERSMLAEVKTKQLKPAERQSVLDERRNLKMARSAHAYVRGNTLKFYEWLQRATGNLIPEGPPVWICGDC